MLSSAMSRQAHSSPRSPRLTGPERREQILDETLALAAREGFHALTIDAVARAAGITRPIVYGHFTDLAGLLHALVDRESARAREQLAEVVPVVLDPRPALETALAAFGTFLHAVAVAPDRWRLVLMPIEGSPRVLQERIAADRARVGEQLRALITAGLEREDVRAGVDVPLVAHAVQDVAEGAARLVLSAPAEYDHARLLAFARAALGLVLRPAA
jgi:AcrR family transcriptional regulator